MARLMIGKKPQRYNPKEMSPKWQQKWAESPIYEAKDDSVHQKIIILEYFPYPSGAAIARGHVALTIGDAMGRPTPRMRATYVLHPMVGMRFGLAAETTPSKQAISPRQAIVENTTRFKKQLVQMGFGYDWSRANSPAPIRIIIAGRSGFPAAVQRGLAYQKESLANGGARDKTVLATQVRMVAGVAAPTLKRKRSNSGFFKITDYADVWLPTSTTSTGPIVSKTCSATGSAALRAGRSILPLRALTTRRSRSSLHAQTPCTAQRLWWLPRSILTSNSHDGRTPRASCDLRQSRQAKSDVDAKKPSRKKRRVHRRITP